MDNISPINEEKCWSKHKKQLFFAYFRNYKWSKNHEHILSNSALFENVKATDVNGLKFSFIIIIPASWMHLKWIYLMREWLEMKKTTFSNQMY